MSPARTRSRCVAPGCHQGAAGAALCDDHFYGRKPWETDRPHNAPRLCSVPECHRVHYARGWCAMHYQREQRRGPLGPLRTAPWNPYYTDRPCPACGSRATVPFDPRPERAGRGPTSGLGTCVSCGHVFRSPASSPSVAPPPEAAGGENGGGRSSAPSGVAGKSPAAPLSKSTDPERVTRGRRNEVTVLTSEAG